jgi:hypothetical protein
MPAEELAWQLERRNAPAQMHLDNCAHCAAEHSLFVGFLELSPTGAEPFAVRWVENRIRMPWDTAVRRRQSWKAWLFGPQVLAPAAMAFAALVLTIGVGVRNETGIAARQEMLQSAERSQGVELISPKGDLAKAPEELRWAAVVGAAQYRVQILEVDRVVLWQGTTTSLMVRVPVDVQNKVLPGKRLIWQVEALDAGGKELAQSSQSFRKKLASTH